MLFALKDLLADQVIMDEHAIKKTGQTLFASSSAAPSRAVQSPPPQQHETSGSSAYLSKIDRHVLVERKKRSEGADSLLALTNAQPDAITTNTIPSLSIDPDIICVCDFVDLTRSDR